MPAKVLISDQLDPLCCDIFQQKGIVADYRPGLSAQDLIALIPAYDGLAVRSETKVNADIIKAATNLKIIGRAGIGIDNIDLSAATQAGIVVMNTPHGNSITTAEHTIAMMFALARQIPQASASTHAGKWEKKKFMGVELYSKTLGVIGCGNIGAIVADRARGIKMNVIAYDPFLTLERAIEIGVEKVTLEELLRRADFITLHVPKTEQTTGIINANSIVLMKDGVRLINCARGGLIVEADLHAALMSGKVAGAALDVFEAEPAHDNILFGHENVICTPHLGAATSEAQTNVALQIAEQMSDYLTSGAVMNALNMPAISKEDAPRLQPYLKLANQLGLLISQIIEGAVIKISIEYEGTVAELNTKPLSAAALANILRSQLETVNIVNAPALAEARGISLRESHSGNARDWRSVITLYVTTEKRAFQVTGTLFTGREPRLVNIDGVPIEAALCPHMLYIVNVDMPGVIGAVGSLLGQSGQNIADFRLGRKEGENQAVCLVALDDEVPDSVVKALSGLMAIKQVKRLRF